MINITFPDNTIKQFSKGIKAIDIAKNISENFAREVLVCKIDNKLLDTSTKINKDCNIQFFTSRSKEGLETLRHSAAHIMADAVKKLFNAKMTIGPVVEDGFYYDFEMEKPFTDEDIPKIEEEMKNIINEKLEFKREEISKKEALELFSKNKYKIELINEFPKTEKISTYSHGKFMDLCRGPHIQNTNQLSNFKIMKIAAAYWKGDAKNKQLQRVYGTCFEDKKELKRYLIMLQEAKKRDHKKIGKELKLFTIHEEGPGFPFWHPKGLHIFNKLLEFWRQEHTKAGYQEIKTPIMLTKTLWERSGHWENYKENMYTSVIDDEEYAIKPMNCPGGMLMYNEDVHSYKELPLRVGEIGLVHRHELSGTLSGLFRVRQFHQDDAHIFMTKDQIKDEILGVINLADKFYSLFGLEYHLELSTRPVKSIGTDKQWQEATDGLKSALDATGKEYNINEGDGAFYGPKIDFHIKDAIKRTWQCGTIQLDMSLPERFNLKYMGEDGENKHRPIMIHRVIYGALERFIGILIEHYAGKFPLWLSPEQVRILTVADRHLNYAKKVHGEYEKEGIKITIDSSSTSISKKVRNAQLDKVNYILVIGDKEIEDDTVTVRTRDNVVIGPKEYKRFKNDLINDINKKV